MDQQSPFAVITGASRGIGEAYAKALAQKGYDLLLVARNQERLDQVAKDLQEAYGVAADQESLDLAQNGSAQVVFEKAMSLRRPIALVIHNAGFGHYGSFWNMPQPKILDMLHLHIRHVTESTRLFLPQMIHQKGGAIINVASIAGFFSIPFMAEYAATKAYLIAFSEAISWEVRSLGITIQVCCPGYTQTDFHSTAGHHPRHILFPQSSHQVAMTSLQALKSRKTVVTIGWQGRIAYWAARCLPRTFLKSLAQQFVKPPSPSN